jgi:hypothetical protein
MHKTLAEAKYDQLSLLFLPKAMQVFDRKVCFGTLALAIFLLNVVLCEEDKALSVGVNVVRGRLGNHLWGYLMALAVRKKFGLKVRKYSVSHKN